MPLLFNAVKLLPEVITVKSNKEIKDKEQRLQQLLELNTNAKSLVGDIAELNIRLDKDLLEISNDLRLKTWKETRTLPKGYEMLNTTKGNKADQFTILNRLPKANTAQLKSLADLMNMVIIPVDYSDIYEIFKTQKNSWSLTDHYKHVNKLIQTDFTTKYNIYMLAPVQYYNLWNHIKSEKDIPIYYPTALETVFTTIELMVPAQRNLYLATKANTDNINKLAANMDNLEVSLKANIETINNKLENVITKVNTLEAKQFELEQKQKIAEENRKQAIIAAQEYIATLRNMDPIMFAVPADVNITTTDTNTMIMMYWGADIAEMIFKVKGLDLIPNKDKNPMNMNLTVEKLNLKIADIDTAKLLTALELVSNDRNIKIYQSENIDGYTIKLRFHINEVMRIQAAEVLFHGKTLKTFELDKTFDITDDVIELVRKSYYFYDVIRQINREITNIVKTTPPIITFNEFKN